MRRHRKTHPVTVRAYPADTVGYQERNSHAALLTSFRIPYCLRQLNCRRIALRVPMFKAGEAKSRMSVA